MSGSSRRPTESTTAAMRARGAGGSLGGSGDDPCALLFEVDLEGIQVGPLSDVAVGTVLGVETVLQGKYKAVVAQSPAGVVGTLAAFPGLATLIRCMEDGNGYSATVRAKTPSTCRVSVKRTVSA